MHPFFCWFVFVCSAQASRTLYAATPLQLDASFAFYFDPSVPLAEDVDVVAIHDDFYGVPWSAFMSSSPNISDFPHSWLGRLNATLEAVIAWDKPVFLTLGMLNGPLRTCPSRNASDGPSGGPVVSAFSGCDSCFDFNTSSNPLAAEIQRAYALYAAFYVDALLSNSPRGLVGVNFSPELNLGQRLCPPEWWEGLIAYANGIYAVLRAQLDSHGATSVPVFPSLQLEVVMGLQTGPDQACVGQISGGETGPSQQLQKCIKDGLALLSAVERDAFMVSTYPGNIIAGYPNQGPPVPSWYFAAVLEQLSSKDRSSFGIAETGFDSVSLVVNLGNGTVGAGSSPLVTDRALSLPLDAVLPPVSTFSIPLALSGSSAASSLSAASPLQASALDPPLYCASFLNSSLAVANDYLSYVIATGESEGWALITWWSDMDFLWTSSMDSCPCETPPAYTASCTFISAYREIYAEQSGPAAAYVGEVTAKAFGAMGLRDSSSTEKTLLWQTMQTARGRRGRDT